MASPTPKMVKICTPEYGYAYGKVFDDLGRTKIARIFISHGDRISSLQFQYVDNETMVLSDLYGETSASKYDIVTFEYPTEYITRISGCIDYQSQGLKTLSIGTNKRMYGPFGGTPSTGNLQRPYANDKEFQFNFGPDRHFFGFHGKYSLNSVTCIGVYLNPATKLHQVKKETT